MVIMGPPTTVNTPRRFRSARISFIRCLWMPMPVTPTMSAQEQRSKSMASTFSSIRVMSCPAGVKAASNGRQATGVAARLPMSGRTSSMPQNEMSNRGLMMTMSAMNGRALGAGCL